MKKHAFAILVVILLITVALTSCGTASSMRKTKVGCPSTRFSIGY